MHLRRFGWVLLCLAWTSGWTMIFPEQGMAQPTLNCSAGTLPPNTTVLSQYSSWQEFTDSLALLVCNYQVGSEGGGSNSAGFAINVEYRCPAETADTWEGITFDHGDEEVARGSNYLHLSKTGSFTSYAGQFPIRERYWWLLDSQTIVKVILFTNGSLGVTSLLDTLASPLAGANRPSARTCSSPQPPSQNNPPTVTLTYSPQNPVVGDEINLQAQASDLDGDPLAYVWLLGGQQQQADASNVVFTPAQAGTYQVTVQVSDGKGGTDEDSVSITVTATARSLIVEVLGAEQHEPLHDVPVKIVRISDGSVVAQGQTNSRGRTSPMNVPTSSSSSGLADLRAVVSFSGSEDPTFAYEQRWSDIPPELLQPSDEPRLFVVFLDFAGPSPEDAALVVPRRAGEAPCFDVEALGEVTITRIEHRGNLPRDKVMLFDQHYWGTSDTISLGYSAGARLQVPEDTSVTLHIANWAIIDLEPNTVFEIPCKTDPLGPPESWLEGVAEFLIQNAGNGYEVQTRTAISGVRGTHFRVDASSPANTRVEVFEGTVEVTPTNPSLDSATVQAGQQMSVTEDEVSPVTPIGGTPPPPPGPPGPPSGNQTIAQALDANGNAILDDVEIRQAIQFWILGQTVPGTDQTIDDVMIRQLIQMWILGEPVSSASAARTQGLDRTNSLDVQALQLGAPSLLERTLRVQGLNGERWRSGVQKLLVLH